VSSLAIVPKDNRVATWQTCKENARNISLPSLWQHYLVAMAASLAKSEKKVQIHYLHPMRSAENIARIGPADPEIIVLREIIYKERNYGR